MFSLKSLPRSNTHGRKLLVPMKFDLCQQYFGSGGRIYSLRESTGTSYNRQPYTVTGSLHQILTIFRRDSCQILHVLAVFTGNAWEYCCQETLTWVATVELYDIFSVCFFLNSLFFDLNTPFIASLNL